MYAVSLKMGYSRMNRFLWDRSNFSFEVRCFPHIFVLPTASHSVMRIGKPHSSKGAMGLLRRSTPFFSVLWLAGVFLHLSHHKNIQPPNERQEIKTAGDLRGAVMRSAQNAGVTPSLEPIHLVYSSDDKEIPGVEASIRSVMCHASEPVVFHYIGESPLTSLPEVKFYNLTEVADKYKLVDFTNPYERTKDFEIGLNSHPANFVRFVIDSLLPQASKAMWIDVDTIVRCDVVPMVRNALENSNHIISAVPLNRKPMGVNAKVLKRQYKKLEISFNAGVYVVDLNRWRAKKITDKIRKLTLKNRKTNMYKYGSQPPLVLTIGQNFEHLSWKWNAKADHFDRPNEPPYREEACLIHWSGTDKPWNEHGILKDLWVPCSNVTVSH